MQNTVDWFNKAVIYHIFIDRFNGCKTNINTLDFLGGNLKGVISKLDYIQNLGINVMWLSPFYKTTHYHGYHITDFKSIDPRFGSKSELLELIYEAKKRGLRIIADFVPNHCSDQHPFFKDALKNKDSKYKDWFIFKKWPNKYLCFLDVKELPKLNLDNRETRNYIIDVADYWLSMGIDGFRIDHAIGPSHDFFREFRRAIKNKYPNAVLIGEVWAEGIKNKYFETIGVKNKILRKIFGISQEKIQLEYYNELDGVLDFELNNIIVECVKRGGNLLSDKRLKYKIKRHFNRIPSDYFMVAFLDNHDMDRFLRHCNGNIQILMDAFKLLFSLNCPVVIYYGTENCFFNNQPVDGSKKYSDLFARKPFDWDNINQEFVESFRNQIKITRDM
jgi:glycosidase